MIFTIRNDVQRDRMLEQADRFDATAHYIRNNPATDPEDRPGWLSLAVDCKDRASAMRLAAHQWDTRNEKERADAAEEGQQPQDHQPQHQGT